MASYKFWQTQPVPRFGQSILLWRTTRTNRNVDDTANVEEGPIKIVDPEAISKEPKPLPENYEWVTMDLTDEKEVILVLVLFLLH